MIACDAPDGNLGAAVRIAAYLDCQARALGENGFQALVGGPVIASLLSGLVTIFIALIGYRLLLGQVPSLSDGIGRTARLGLVLALVTSWPAFQTLVYRVAVDGPTELAATLLPASGLPSDGMESRVQAAYDTMRLGWSSKPANEALTPPDPEQADGQTEAMPRQSPATDRTSIGQPALPQTASLFVMSTVGTTGAFKLAIGFLLAVAPLAILALLFDATLGLFSGWVRSLGGAALAALAGTMVTAVHLVVVESELASAQAYGRGGVADAIDTQALTTITLSFLAVMLVAVVAALRMAGAFRLPLPVDMRSIASDRPPASTVSLTPSSAAALATARPDGSATTAGQTRTAAVADALAATVRREQAALAGGGSETLSRSATIVGTVARSEPGLSTAPIGVSGRRSMARRTRSAAHRDRMA